MSRVKSHLVFSKYPSQELPGLILVSREPSYAFNFNFEVCCPVLVCRHTCTLQYLKASLASSSWSCIQLPL